MFLELTALLAMWGQPPQPAPVSETLQPNSVRVELRTVPSKLGDYQLRLYHVEPAQRDCTLFVNNGRGSGPTYWLEIPGKTQAVKVKVQMSEICYHSTGGS